MLLGGGEGVCLPIWNIVEKTDKFDRRPGQSFNCLLGINAFITIKTENLIAAFSLGWINKLVRIEVFFYLQSLSIVR